MAESFEETQKVVSGILSQLLDTVSQDVSGFNYDNGNEASIYSDVEATVKQLLDQVSQPISVISSATTEKGALKIASKNTTSLRDYKSLPYMGISQSGRLMDPICLQQTM